MPSERENGNQWQFGLRDICLLTAAVAFLMAVGQLPVYSGEGMVHPYAVLGVIYIIKYRLSHASLRRRDLGILFGAMLISVLPYVYWRVVIWEDGPIFISSMAQLIGYPIWIFAVPSASFIAFDDGIEVYRVLHGARQLDDLL